VTERIVIIPGSKRINLRPLHTAARTFGWTVDTHAATAADLGEIAAALRNRGTVALLLFRDALGPERSWAEVIRLLRPALPNVRLIACHEFSEPIDWPALSDAGAFHALCLPLKENELRQCLGFVWEAGKRLPDSIRKPPVAVAARPRELISCPA
jgi:hypothetical protein